MPRPSKGPRLYLRKPKGQEAVYVIRDGQKEVSTGCAATDVDGASQSLRDYLSDNFRPDTGERSLNKIGCAEVLMLYLTDLPADSPTRKTIGHHMKPLNAFWGDKSLADVKGSTCREYQRKRSGSDSFDQRGKRLRSVKDSTSRQELKTFQAAINHWHRESPLAAVPKVTLPKPGSRRERVLERSEVARMLWACRKLSRTGHKAAKGAVQYTDYSHVARFILIGIYTGTRHDAILRISWNASDSGGYIDIARGIVFRRGILEQETSKRRPALRLTGRFLATVVRWRNSEVEGISHVIHYKGQRVTKMKRAWNTVREAAGLGSDVTPHVLRHTCVSWLLWGREGRGARPATKPLTIWEVAGIVGADASTIEKVYGHHRRVE